MKLHLPTSLRKALILALSAVSVGVSTSAYAASRSDQLTRATYCDFGDNKGQYAVHGVNDLLQHLRDTQGIRLTYLTEGKADYVWDSNQPLINYDSRVDAGAAAGIGYNFIATVQHNGVANPTFTASTIGDDKAIHYAGIEYRSSENNTFLLVPGIDYKVTRLSKIITDVTGSGVYTGDYNSLIGKTWYRSGSGTMYKVSPEKATERESGAYAYCIGGIMQITSAGLNAKEGQVDVRGLVDDSGSVVINKNNWWKLENINDANPLPFVIQAGDSGSPTWIYDSESGSYLYAGAMQSGEGVFFSQARYAGQWTEAVMTYFNRNVSMPDTGVVHIGAADTLLPGHSDSVNKVTSRPYQGAVKDAEGNVLQTYQGLQQGAHTWKALNKDAEHWYAYGNQYLNTGSSLTYADLFETQDLVFRGNGGQQYDIKLDADVDLGLGYMRFMGDSTANTKTSFNLSNNENGNFRLDTAGFIVDAGVDLYLNLNGTQNYAREWRKIGDGNLHITGNGDNYDVLLNLGGSGSTYLERTGGYAAYNVLANNGTTVVINGENQIKRDFTFGYGGALLDMNGRSMIWNNDAAGAGRFTIHALTDEAVISNLRQESVTKLTWTQGGQREYLGSFVDKADGGVFQFIYNAEAENSRLVLHSIYTNLGNAAEVDGQRSGIIVRNGTLALQGTNTLHAPGSLGVNFSNARYSSAEDWHYADSKTAVTVEGGTFELGHHARLTGDVTVNGGTFLMREGVTHQYEYVEGGYEKMDTNTIAGYFGLKGHVKLEANGSMHIAFNENADSTLVYDGRISGTGSLVVNPGILGGMVVLGGDNREHTGAKTLERGGMRVTTLDALGNTQDVGSKWKLTNSGYLVLDTPFDNLTHEQVLQYVYADSDGILALTKGTDEAYNLSGHNKLIIGANEGAVVQYGTSGQELEAQTGDNGERYWKFGGGGGELVVNFQLNDQGGQATNLILGADYAQGVVNLTNENNSFSGTISFNGGVTLKYASDRALGNASFSVNYTNRVMTPGGLAKIKEESDGVLLVDQVLNQELDLTRHSKLAIGSQGNGTYTGDITIAQNADYHFGGSTGTLVVEKQLRAFGTNNLDVDGQTFSGGEIFLKAGADISGSVSVYGYNQEKATQILQETGDIVLGLGVNNALAKVQSVDLQNGGFIDLHGTAQTLNDLSIGAGSGVIDTSGTRKSILQVKMSKDLAWAGSVDAGTVFVDGAHKLTLSGTSYYDKLYIRDGATVMLDTNNALSALGTTYVESGSVLNANRKNTWGDIYVRGTLDANGAGFSGVVTLDNGTINLKSGSLSSESTLISMGGRVQGKNVQINGTAYFTAGTTVFSLEDPNAISDGDYARIAGSTSISKGATLKFIDGGFSFLNPALCWKYSISSTDFNVAETFVDELGHETKEEKGTLRLETKWLFLHGADQNFGGTVQVAADNLNITAAKGTKTFDRLENKGATRLTNISDSNPANWVIHELAGTGTLQIESANWAKLDGAGTFTGTLAAQKGTLELAHEQALALATLNLNSGTLAVSAGIAKVKNLTGNGVLLSGVAGDRVSTKNTTLEIVGTGINSTFSGSAVCSNHRGLSVQMSGTGTQAFSGSSIHLQDVSVKSGTLSFAPAAESPDIQGDAAISRGAVLDFGSKSLYLGEGQALRIQDGSGDVATFKGNLDFAGGKVVFDSSILSVNAAVFKLDGAAMYHEGTSSLLVNFTNEDVLLNGTYKLSTGDWSAVKDSISSDSLIYHSATFSADNTSLSVTIGDRTDIQVWNGENGKSGWNDKTFGNETNNLTQGSTAVFNDDAASANVSITSNVEVKELVFDNDENTYRLVTGAGAGVQADKLRQVGDSSTELTGNFHAAAADVEAGTLSLGRGSSVDTVNVAESATVVLKDADRQPETISGDGTVRVDWGAENTQALNIGRIGVVEVESGHVDMTGQDSVSMNVLHVKENTSFAVTAQAGNFADKAIVDKDGRLEASISAFGTSGLATELSGAGTVSLTNSREVDLGDHEVSGGRVDASAFTGTLELGNGEQKMRFRSSNVTGLGQGATIEVADKSQYWVTDNNCVVNANLLLHGDSGAAKGNSWKNEGFGAVRGAKVVNGDVIIDGNAMLSGNDQKNITFNGAVKSYNDSGEDTMTLGCYYSNGAMTYTFAEGSDASGLDNIVLRRSGGAGTGQGSILNIESDKGLARNVQFYAGTTDGAQVNINAAATADTLKSAAGDGVVNIAEGKSLELTRGQVYGGSIHLGDGVAVTAAEGQVATVQDRVTYGVDGAASATISGTGATRMENAAIDLAEGSRLVMENITLSTNSTVTDETAAAALAAKSLKLEAKVGENLMRRESVAARMQPLTYGLDMPQPKMAAAAADDVVSFTLTNVSGVSLVGDALMISLVGDSSAAWNGAEWLSVSLADGGTFDDALNVTLLYEDAEGAQKLVQGVYTMDDVAAAAEAAQPHDYVYFHLAGAAGVPEPASATLSLLALAALAARRRRKG